MAKSSQWETHKKVKDTFKCGFHVMIENKTVSFQISLHFHY